MAIYSQLYIHCVWTTWERLPLIESIMEPELYAMFAAKCQTFDCQALAIGGVADHVHLLIEFTSTITIAKLIGEIKGASSHMVNKKYERDGIFTWQKGYGVFTLSKRSVPNVQTYIANQKLHHKHGTLIPELEAIA